MQVLHVCSEMFPLLKTGGLADVIGALPAAQIAEGIDTRVLLPAFPDIRRGVVDEKIKADIDRKHAVSRFKFQTLPVYHNGLPMALTDETDYYK